MTNEFTLLLVSCALNLLCAVYLAHRSRIDRKSDEQNAYQAAAIARFQRKFDILREPCKRILHVDLRLED